jgi:hypothetical protein
VTSKKVYFKSDILLQLPGYLLVCSIIIAIITGLLLAFYYVPTPQSAAVSISRIQEEIFAGSLIVTMHRLSGIFAILFTLCNLIIIVVSKRFSYLWSKIWYTGVLLVILFAGLRITGFILMGNEPALNIIKLLSTQFAGTAAQLTSLPELFDSMPKIFNRVYMVHILVLPGVVCYIIYHHVKALKGFAADFQPFPIRPGTVLFIFTTMLIIISLFIRPIDEPIAAYGENWSALVPCILQFLILLKRAISLPGAVISIILGITLLLSVGLITKRLEQ